MDPDPINPSPPNTANLTWRPISQDDLAAVVNLLRAGLAADGGIGFLFEPEYVQQSYFPDAPGAAIGGWMPAGRLGACASAYMTGEASPPKARMVGMVRPDLRGRGIGDFLLRWSTAHAQALLAGSAGSGAMMQIVTESLSDPADRLYRRHGFELWFEELVMERDLLLPIPDRPLPPGVTIATWRADLAGLFFQAYHASFRERPGFPGYSAETWISQVTGDDPLPEWSLLAISGSAPVGFVLCSSELTRGSPIGHIWQIGVVPEQRRGGLASALLVVTMRRMQAAGAMSALLTVNINNPGAIKAYELLGFKTVGRRARYERSGEAAP